MPNADRLRRQGVRRRNVQLMACTAAYILHMVFYKAMGLGCKAVSVINDAKVQLLTYNL